MSLLYRNAPEQVTVKGDGIDDLLQKIESRLALDGAFQSEAFLAPARA